MKDRMPQQNETFIQRENVRAASETAKIERSLEHLTGGASPGLSQDSETSNFRSFLEEIRKHQASGHYSWTSRKQASGHSLRALKRGA
jgi:hypothetical protein